MNNDFIKTDDIMNNILETKEPDGYTYIDNVNDSIEFEDVELFEETTPTPHTPTDTTSETIISTEVVSTEPEIKNSSIIINNKKVNISNRLRYLIPKEYCPNIDYFTEFLSQTKIQYVSEMIEDTYNLENKPRNVNKTLYNFINDIRFRLIKLINEGRLIEFKWETESYRELIGISKMDNILNYNFGKTIKLSKEEQCCYINDICISSNMKNLYNDITLLYDIISGLNKYDLFKVIQGMLSIDINCIDDLIKNYFPMMITYKKIHKQNIDKIGNPIGYNSIFNPINVIVLLLCDGNNFEYWLNSNQPDLPMAMMSGSKIKYLSKYLKTDDLKQLGFDNFELVSEDYFENFLKNNKNLYMLLYSETNMFKNKVFSSTREGSRGFDRFMKMLGKYELIEVDVTSRLHLTSKEEEHVILELIGNNVVLTIRNNKSIINMKSRTGRYLLGIYSVYMAAYSSNIINLIKACYIIEATPLLKLITRYIETKTNYKLNLNTDKELLNFYKNVSHLNWSFAHELNIAEAVNAETNFNKNEKEFLMLFCHDKFVIYLYDKFIGI